MYETNKILWMTKILLQDKLMTAPTDSSGGSSGNWLFKNKEHGKASAAASLVLEQLVFFISVNMDYQAITVVTYSSFFRE
jgi:hypothetical protein